MAIGLVFAALLARRLGRIDDDAGRASTARVVGSFDLPTDLPAGRRAPRSWSTFMGRDKKAQQDLTFVLDGPDGVEVVHGVAAADVVATLADMGAPHVSLVLLLSGPNLNLLGRAGAGRLRDRHPGRPRGTGRGGGGPPRARARAPAVNHEGDLIEAVHAARGRADALVINAGALSHTSWSLHDAVAAFDGPVVELHLSNPAAREPFRHTSVLAPVATGSSPGFGGLGYELAVDAVAALLKGT